MPRLSVVPLALLALTAAGCVKPKPAPIERPAPPVTLDLGQSIGSPLIATTAPAADINAADLIGLEVTWVALEKMPDGVLDPLDAQSSLTSAPLAEGPILTLGRATRVARFGGGLAADALLARIARRTDGAAAQVGHQTAWVAPGTTVRFRCDAVAPRRSVAIAVYRTPQTMTRSPTQPATAPFSPSPSAATPPASTSRPEATAPATSASRPTTATSSSAPSDVAPIHTPVAFATFAITLDVPATTRPSDIAAQTGAETAYVEHVPLSVDTPFALVLPWPAADGHWSALAAYVEVLPRDATAANDVIAAATDWNARVARRRQTPLATTAPTGDQLTLRRATDALKSAADPRPALIYLAAVTNARIAGDVALVADKNLLDKLRYAVTAGESADAATPEAATPEIVGWLLDRTTLLTLADAGSKAALPPEMVAALAVHAGEVGRHTDTLTTVVNGVGNAADLHARLIAENYISLEDNAASSRVRAFDWLKAQGRAPAGYDPLGPARARRAAINRAITAPGGTP